MRSPDEELQALENEGLRRHLRPVHSPQGAEVILDGNRKALNFSSNDYLGLANSELLKESFSRNIQKHGAGAGASRLVCGSLSPHLELEAKLAAYKETESALTFSSGFATATGVIPALCGKNDFVILDKLCHASLIDGARLSSATMRIFPHNDLAKLEQHLHWARAKAEEEDRILIVTESIFSMDGDRAPLPDIVSLKERFNALLLVDEAHGFGIIGPHGRGLAAETEVDSAIDLQMGTFSKAAGLSGGYVCADKAVIELLVNRARSFIYSTAPSPALAATISETLDLISGKEGDALRSRLWDNIRLFAGAEGQSAIVPKIMGENEAALQASATLLDRGYLVPAIRFPTVPRGTARLRITLSANHTADQITQLKKSLACLDESR